MTSYQQTTYGHRKLPPIVTGGQRFARGHRTTESIDLNSPPLSPAIVNEPWFFFDFTWEVRCSTGPGGKVPRPSWVILLFNFCKTFALLYVFASAAYCSIRLLSWLHGLPSLEHIVRQVHSGQAAEPALDLLLDDSPGFRLSKLVTMHPLAGTSNLQLDFIRPAYDVFSQDDITACLHVAEEDIVLVPQWLEAWNGPVSLVVSIPHPPTSVEYIDALARLRKLSASHPALHKALSIHALPTSSADLRISTNAQLNLARLYAQTSRVALFADGTLNLQPINMDTLKDSASSEVSFYRTADGTFPVITLPRDALRWCPERWFGADPTEFDQCLWLFVLYFGNKGDQEWLNSRSNQVGSASAERSTKRLGPMKIRYQAEACMIAAREQVALGLWADRKPGSRADWIEKMCKRAFDPSGITLLESEPAAI